MQGYFLESDVYFCEIDDGAIFLELTTHKYFAIGSQYLTALRHSVCGWPKECREDNHLDQASTDELLDELVQKGFLTRSETKGKLPPSAIAPAEDSIATIKRSELGHPIRLRDVMRFVRAFNCAAHDLRLARLKNIVTRLDRRRTSLTTFNDRGAPIEQARHLAGMFRRLRPWAYSARSACLLDSVALVEFLSYYGFTASLVIGVNTKPFGAHAWVQMGRVVINDTAEHVQEYTPILSV